MRILTNGSVTLDLLALLFAGLAVVGLAATVLPADTCEGRGYQTTQGEHKLACAGAGNCAGVCNPIEDTTTHNGLTITWCGCNQQPGAQMSCSNVSTKCTPVLLKNAGGSVWLACMNCDCRVNNPPQLNGRCGVVANIPVGGANAADTCTCVRFDDDEDEDE